VPIALAQALNMQVLVLLTAAMPSCQVAPVSVDELAVALARLINPPRVQHPQPVERLNQNKIPSESDGELSSFPNGAREEVRLLAGYIRNASRCAAGSEFRLACPEHVQSVPFEFAVLAESVRQATIVCLPGFCKSTFLSLAEM
jgi:hypothetical protein